MIYKYKKYLLLGGILLLLLPFSWITRLTRPQITGRVLDYQDKQPVENCEVGNTKTDKNGYFTLPAITRKVFIIPEIFYMEAPPLFVSEVVKKAGYENERIEVFNKYGGGLNKKTSWNLGTIYLKKTNQELNLSDVFNGKWNMSLTKTNDTVFLVKDNIHDYIFLAKNSNFHADYHRHTDNYLDSFGPNNLPEGIIRKNVSLDIIEDKIDLETIIQYGQKDGKNTTNERKDNDTISNSGTWKSINAGEIQFNTNSSDLNGKYEIIRSDILFLQLKKM